jgi:hypothetical protein
LPNTLLGHLRARDGEQAEAQRVGHGQRMLVQGHQMHPDDRERRCRQDHVDIAGVADPEHRMAVEQQVAQRAAAHRGDRGDHHHTQPVEARMAGRQGPTDREDRHAGEIEDVEQHGRPSVRRCA